MYGDGGGRLLHQLARLEVSGGKFCAVGGESVARFLTSRAVRVTGARWPNGCRVRRRKRNVVVAVELQVLLWGTEMCGSITPFIWRVCSISRAEIILTKASVGDTCYGTIKGAPIVCCGSSLEELYTSPKTLNKR